jgi:hypothetical protein
MRKILLKIKSKKFSRDFFISTFLERKKTNKIKWKSGRVIYGKLNFSFFNGNRGKFFCLMAIVFRIFFYKFSRLNGNYANGILMRWFFWSSSLGSALEWANLSILVSKQLQEAPSKRQKKNQKTCSHWRRFGISSSGHFFS